MEKAEEGVVEGVTELIRGEAIRNAPIDTSHLRGSDFMNVKRKNKQFTVTFGFNTPYAAVQDQNTTFNHPKGGKAGYLSDTFRKNIPNIKSAINKAIRGKR